MTTRAGAVVVVVGVGVGVGSVVPVAEGVGIDDGVALDVGDAVGTETVGRGVGARRAQTSAISPLTRVVVAR